MEDKARSLLIDTVPGTLIKVTIKVEIAKNMNPVLLM